MLKKWTLSQGKKKLCRKINPKSIEDIFEVLFWKQKESQAPLYTKAAPSDVILTVSGLVSLSRRETMSRSNRRDDWHTQEHTVSGGSVYLLPCTARGKWKPVVPSCSWRKTRLDPEASVLIPEGQVILWSPFVTDRLSSGTGGLVPTH